MAVSEDPASASTATAGPGLLPLTTLEIQMRPAAVVLAILDAFPHSKIGPELTPTLWSLVQQGGWAPDGGRAVLTASTYPNHATFVTGALPVHHGILTNRVLVDGKFEGAEKVGPSVATLFDACAAADRRSLGIFGDQNLVGVCGADRAAVHWPPNGVLPEGAPKGALGYGADRAVVEAVDQIDVDTADLLVLQFDEVDSIRHLHGPYTDAALEQCRATDCAFGQLLERIRPRWEDTVVIVVSDHDQEEVHPGAIDLQAEATAKGLDVLIDHEGTSALVAGDVDEALLLELPGVSGAARLSEDRVVVWGDPGTQYGIDFGLKAQHGSPRTLTQLAVVGGGHESVAGVARRLKAAAPEATEWAGIVRQLMRL